MTCVRTVAVVGAGTMGHGIAQVAAQTGHAALLWDARPGAAAAGRERAAANLAGAVARGKLSAADRDATLLRLASCADLQDAVRDAELVIEAVPEDLALKQDLFRRLEAFAPPGAILATNTSSLSIAAIAGAVVYPGRVIGMHFFNPVHLMRLVEVVVHDETGASVREQAVQTARAFGKEPIVVRDTPGFATSRLGLALGLEAMRMLEEGVADAEDIDRAMTLGYNHPMGPLRLTDLVGLDVRLAIASYLYQTLGQRRFEPPAILRRLVAEGKLGKKTGTGFYTWPADSGQIDRGQ